jgi:hypothetical protein
VPIVLVTDTEKLSLPLGDSTLYYRRVPALKRAELVQKFTTFGLVDEPGWQLAMVEYALTGWDNVTTLDGVAVPFEARLVGTLPPPVIGQLMAKIQETSPSPEAIVKNSPGLSSGALPSAA